MDHFHNYSRLKTHLLPISPIHNSILLAEADIVIKILSLLGTRGATHRHIVLALKHEDNWGAIGISRRHNLMDKTIEFKSLAELICDYELSYVSIVFVSLLPILNRSSKSHFV